MSANVASDIVNFFNGQRVFITGATGYLGSVLLRKILKECGDDIGPIYLLVRCKNDEDAKVRIQKLLKDQVGGHLTAATFTQFHKRFPYSFIQIKIVKCTLQSKVLNCVAKKKLSFRNFAGKSTDQI